GAELTFDDYLDGWLDSLVVAGRRNSTIVSYTSALRLHVRPYVGTRSLQSLTPLDFDRLFGHLATKGRAKSDAGLHPTTVRYIATLCPKALEDALDRGLIVRNPAAKSTPKQRAPP